MPVIIDFPISSIKYFQIINVKGTVIPERILTIMVLIKVKCELFHNKWVTPFRIKKNSFVFPLIFLIFFIIPLHNFIKRGRLTALTVSLFSCIIMISGKQSRLTLFYIHLAPPSYIGQSYFSMGFFLLSSKNIVTVLILYLRFMIFLPDSYLLF